MHNFIEYFRFTLFIDILLDLNLELRFIFI
jgi:hypothetical protein